MQMLAGAFAGVADGTPGMLLLGGEAGAGKSRLVAEFTAQVRGRALVLAGGCIDLGRTGLPYAPFMAALLELVRQRGAGEVARYCPATVRQSWPGCCRNSAARPPAVTRRRRGAGCSGRCCSCWSSLPESGHWC